MSKPFIAVCLPSRGVGHYRTILGIQREVEPYRHLRPYCLVVGEPIPDAHNLAVRQALVDERVTHLWLLEDDHLLPAGVLRALLSADAPIAAAQYLLRNGRPSVLRDAHGEVVLTGLGCTLVRREVFERLPDPPFQVGNRLQWEGGGWRDTGQPEYAGGQDIFFCNVARAAGIPITVLDGWQVGHLEAVRTGARANFGMDEIRCWGGDPSMPHYPRTWRDIMGERVYLRLAHGTVIDMDVDSDQYQRFLSQGAQVIKPAEARPALKKQEEQNAAVLVRAEAVDDD